MVSPFVYEHGDRLAVLDLVASFAFKSPGSVSFDLGTEEGGGFKVVGWVDVHHPCEGHLKARFRVVLPVRYHAPEPMQGFVRTMFSALGIPADETYEAEFVCAQHRTRIEQATDRDGGTDRIY